MSQHIGPMAPVLYSQGVLPWKHGYDCAALESLLRATESEGEAYQEWYTQANPAEEFVPPLFERLPRQHPAQRTKHTLTAARSGSSMLPSEHVTSWGYALDSKVLTEQSFSLAAQNASFFPVAAAGFNAHCHVTPSRVAEGTWQLIYYAGKPPRRGDLSWTRACQALSSAGGAHSNLRVGMTVLAKPKTAGPPLSSDDTKWQRAVVDLKLAKPKSNKAPRPAPPHYGYTPLDKYRLKWCGGLGSLLDPRLHVAPARSAAHHYHNAKCQRLEDEAAASGLKWRAVDPKPTSGTELKSEKLAEALKAKARHEGLKESEFTQAEWDAFGITSLTCGHFLDVEGEYYQPTPECRGDGERAQGRELKPSSIQGREPEFVKLLYVKLLYLKRIGMQTLTRQCF